MATEVERELSTNRKRRGVIRASITRLGGRVAELEGKETLSSGDRLAAQRLLPKLEGLDSEFKNYHLAVVDLVGDDALGAEQATLDEHDDRVADFTTRIEQLCAATTGHPTTSTPSEVSSSSILTKRLCRVEKNVLCVVEAVGAMRPESEVDSCLLHQYEERLSGLETELQDVSRGILSLEHDDADLSRQESAIAESLFDVRLRIKRLLSSASKPTSSPVVEEGGVKLPKLSVPTFDGDVVNWKSFWEQFTVSIHDKPKLSSAEKLAYLKHAVKDGSARQVIEGLSASGDHYAEAVDCLRKRYDRPRLLHQAHVRAILKAPRLRKALAENCVGCTTRLISICAH